MAEEVKVFGTWDSAFSKRVELALKLKGVEYEYIEEDIYKNKSPLLLKYNPVRKQIPVLLHNGKPINESLIILEYIDETWKANPILPHHPYDKATARFWAKFIDDKCFPAIRKLGWSTEKERAKAVEEAYECLKTLESALNGKRFFGGDSIGLVDIAANFIGHWFRIVQQVNGQELLVSAENLPELFRWSNEFESCNIVKETLPPKAKLMAFFKARIDAPPQSTSGPTSN